ncbi:MAG: DUF1156 domain-containing protein [Selenomonadaceae bacterium]|nr:DUF1156 domain-containing protein [Selenomonadaceae bacterium]
MARKLIEAAIPLEEINKASAREKSIRHGHPSTLHLWWARRPLATARAVLFASIVDDPFDRPDLYPTVELQEQKRDQLFKLMVELVQWENSSNAEVLGRAMKEMKLSAGDALPHVLDPFAGGGTIPLEAQRLGLHAHATDLNPVAVLINKSMIELPARFKDQPPRNPNAHETFGNDTDWHGAQGLAVDVEYYGRRLKALAAERIGSMYPTVAVDGRQATVIAWIWARTVQCNNPVCGCTTPLVHSFVLSKKQNVSVRPIIEGNDFRFEVEKLEKGGKAFDGTISRSGAQCIHCGSVIKFEHIRAAGKAGRLGTRLMAIVAEGKGGRIYLEPNDEHVRAADVPKPEDYPEGELCGKARANVSLYGFNEFHQLFTNRQLTALTTFSDLISTVRDEVIVDTDDKEYANAVTTYLAFAIDKLANVCNSLGRWRADVECPVDLFARQSIPMVWDFAEGNPFSSSSGSLDVLLKNMLRTLSSEAYSFNRKIIGTADQGDVLKGIKMENVLISTDPPYYDNVSYADLSDFFYVWLRRSIRKIYPRLLMRMSPPKDEELISNPYRHGGKDSARKFFEDGMRVALKNIYDASTVDYPISIYYAYKQDDAKADDDRLSAGWETLLRSIIDAGFIIVGTWPVRTEMMSRSVAMDTNSLSTSIVIVCRKPPAPKEPCGYNRFFQQLSFELGGKLERLQSANLSPVDMSQAAIGPGMEIYSRYSEVRRGDGRLIDVRSALMLINKGLEDFLNSQDTELDNESKFCVALYQQTGWDEIKFGSAQLLSTAKNVSLTRLRDARVIESGRGIVRLLNREELTDEDAGSCVWSLMQRTVYWLLEEGVEYTVKNLLIKHGDKLDAVKRLSYRMYNITDQKHWTEEAQGYARIVEVWELILTVLRQERAKAERPQEQQTLDM